MICQFTCTEEYMCVHFKSIHFIGVLTSCADNDFYYASNFNRETFQTMKFRYYWKLRPLVFLLRPLGIFQSINETCLLLRSFLTSTNGGRNNKFSPGQCR